MIVEILENGNLKLLIESDDIEIINDAKLDVNIPYDYDLLSDLLELYSCNGSFAYFNAGDGNPFVGLSDAPCIAEQLDYQDNGDIEIIGNYWYYADYMTNSLISELLDNGHVIFNKA